MCPEKGDTSMKDFSSRFPGVQCPQECLTGIPGVGQGQCFIFVPSSRNDYAIIDAAKVADVICVVMSCRGTDYLNMNLNPDKYCNAIDELGYKHISMLRTQGIPEVVGVLQHLDELPEKKQNMVKKFFQRYFEGEFDPKEKFFVLNKNDVGGAVVKHMIRHFASLIPKELSWRRHRSYLIVDKYNYIPESDVMETYGYVHGNQFTTQLPIYITGYGTFLLREIKSEEDPLGRSSNKKLEESKKEVMQIIEIADPERQEPCTLL